MGTKVNPVSFRIPITGSWQARWFADDKRYRQYLLGDIKIRELLMKKLKPAGIAKVEVERYSGKLKIFIHVARPGVLIGRGGTGLTELRKFLMREMEIKNENELEIVPMDLRSPDLSAYLIAQNVAEQLIKRLPARRVMNQVVERVMRVGAKGVRVMLSGRIGGAEIARREWKQAGTMPLHTLRADIDFASAPALTKSGYVGVKVWINKGEVEL